MSAALATERPNLPALTSLRFLAAVHVVAFHLQAIDVAFASGPFADFVSIGYIGVHFFFVLSGFIMVYNYAGRPVAKPRFWRARFARVYPAYAFSLLITAPIFAIAITKPEFAFFRFAADHTLITCLAVVGLLQAWIPDAALSWNPVSWSLSVEAFFYLLFPFLLPWFLDRGRRGLLLVIGGCWLFIMAVPSAYVILEPDGLAETGPRVFLATWLNVVKFNPLVRLPEFFVGMATGLLFLRRGNDDRLGTPLIVITLIGILAFTLVSPVIPYPFQHNGTLAPLFGLLVYGMALRPSWTRFLEVRPLVLLGDSSYSLYLFHATFLPLLFLNPDGTPREADPLEVPARRRLGPRRAKPPEAAAAPETAPEPNGEGAR